MLRNYFKIAFRNLLKNKVYSLLNIFGLALGIAACFFIFQYVHFEKNYDRFNKNINNLYRVTLKFTGSMDNVEQSATNHPAVGPAMKAEFPEVKDFVRFVSITLFINAPTVTYKSPNGSVRSYNETGIFITDPSFFTIFSYPLISGDRNKCLSEPNLVQFSKIYSINLLRENPDILNYDGHSFSHSVDLIALLLFKSLELGIVVV